MNIPLPPTSSSSLSKTFSMLTGKAPRLPAIGSSRETVFGPRSLHGIPFELGLPDMPNVVLLDRDEVRVEACGVRATCVIFLHAVEDWPTRYLEGFTDGTVNGNALGIWVSEYALEYEDGTQASTPVWRRFAIQQSHIL